MSQNTSYYSAEGFKKIKDELQDMISVQRPRISQQIADARDKGDLSENAEYDAAKEAQGMLEARISKLKDVVRNGRVLDATDLDDSRVLIQCNVKIKNVENGMEIEYRIVAENEADLKTRKISVESPIGKGLLGKEVGDIAEVQVPSGIMNFEIMEISR